MTQNRLARGDFLGALRKSARGGGFQVELRIAALPPDAVVEHSHEEAHFILPLDEGYRSLAAARGRARDGGVRAGALIYNPPGVAHRDLFEAAGGRFLSVSTPVSAEIAGEAPILMTDAASAAVARRLVGDCIRFRPGDELALEDTALTLMGLTARGATGRIMPDWLATVKEMIDDLAGVQGLEVRAVAAEIGVHPVHLARTYRQWFGLSPGAAIRIRRADIAMAALVGGARPIEAAAAAGYADQSHMTREHRRFYGVSPGVSTAVLA